MGFNSAFKGLMTTNIRSVTESNKRSRHSNYISPVLFE